MGYHVHLSIGGHGIILKEGKPIMLSKRILVVDDDPAVVRLMRGYLEKAGFDVLTAFDGETALHTLRREKPDLILLDLMLPDRDGIEITRIMRNDEVLCTIPIIMLTARVEDTDKILGLEVGADDYVTKPYNPREVVARVRACFRTLNRVGHQLDDKILLAGDLKLDIGRREVARAGEEISLTPTEFDLLRVLMEQAGYVLTRNDLVQKALGIEYPGLDRTLDSHIRNLRTKVEPDPKNPTYVKTVYGVGYRLES